MSGLMTTSKTLLVTTATFFVFVATAFATLPIARAGDGTQTENFSVQFLADTFFFPQVSVPPQDDNYGAFFVMPPCVEPIKNDCIVSLEYTNSRGEWVKGKFKELIPLRDLSWNDDRFKEDYNEPKNPAFAKARPKQNFPAGGRTGIWQLPGAQHPGGSDYAITLGFPGAASNTTNPRSEGSVISWPASDGFTLKLFPISYDENAPIATGKDPSGKPIGGASSCAANFGKAQYRCVPNTIHPFPAQTKFRITANFKATRTMLAGADWYFGRIINAQVRETLNSDNSISLAISGSPTLVGSVLTEFPKNQTNYEILKRAYETYWEETFSEKSFNFTTYDQFLQSGGTGLSTRDPGTASAWRILEEHFDFKYLFEDETWQVATSRISVQDRSLTEQCGKESLLPGIISTNAVAANPSPPKWNPETNELTYSIASPHTRRDGALNVGVYELTIDKKLAECLWGKDPLQYRAAISVTSPDGTQKVATTLFSSSEKYLSFRAAGFSYSTSLIRVKLTKGQGSEASKSGLPDLFLDTGKKTQASGTTTTPKSTVASSTKKTITCAKGKTRTKVTGTKPICPTGFKKIA